VVLTWVYRNTGRSVLLVAALHTAFNLASATEAPGFVVGAVAGMGGDFRRRASCGQARQGSESG
jgi:membrane protease YdiL (CAAX protease family)